MYKMYFDSEEDARAFVEEINGLGYEWHPVTLTQDGDLTFEASKTVFKEIEKRYFES